MGKRRGKKLLHRNKNDRKRGILGKWVRTKDDESGGEGASRPNNKRLECSNAQHHTAFRVQKRGSPFNLQEAMGALN